MHHKRMIRLDCKRNSLPFITFDDEGDVGVSLLIYKSSQIIAQLFCDVLIRITSSCRYFAFRIRLSPTRMQGSKPFIGSSDKGVLFSLFLMVSFAPCLI